MRERYVHGHHASVLASHAIRTAANSAAYLLPHLRAGQALLDVGCGPGTITLDLAKAIEEATEGTTEGTTDEVTGEGRAAAGSGRVVGLDSVAEPIEAARREAAARGDERTTFQVGDVYALPFDDDSFDVVHAHQVLQHLADPVAALREMSRVARPGGLVAVRDADYEAMTWYPASAGLDRWLDTYRTIARAAGGEPDAGRRLRHWAHAAGLTDTVASASVWCYADEESVAQWAGTWAQRVHHSAFADGCRRLGLGEADLDELADAWRGWGGVDGSGGSDAWFVIVHGEILARV